MKQRISSKRRKDLQAKMNRIFSEDLGELSPEMREILVDDMVTALESRIMVLARFQQPAVQISDTFRLVEKQVKTA